MLMLDANTLLNQLPFTALADELQGMHLDPIGLVDELLIESEGADDTTSHFFIRTGWQQGKALGAKVITVFPANNKEKIWPSIQAIYVLFEGQCGTPVACLDGATLTYLKTATDSALGCRLLARTSIESMLMVGAGEMSRHVIAAHCQVRPSIKQVYVWNRSAENAIKLCEGELAQHYPHINFEPVSDLSKYAAKVGLISCATATHLPLIQGKWLQAGTHLDLIGAFTPEMREADDECLRRGSLFVDARATTINHIGELMIPLANNVITLDDIKADLSDLCQNKHPGRTSDDEITLYKNGGGGHLDLMMARILHAHYQQKHS